MWPIGKKTPNRKKLSKGDRVLFYQGGEHGGKIIGSAELASDLTQDEGHVYDFVMIRSIEFWKKPVEIRTIMKEMSFVKNVKHWGLYFRGGVVRISSGDYKLITEAHE